MGEAAVPRRAFVLVLAVSLAVAALGLAEPLDRRLLDLQLKALRQWHPRAGAAVAVVGIDEDSTRSLGAQPLASHLKTFLAAMEAGRATEVRIDLAPLPLDGDGVVRRYGEGYIDYSRGAAFDYVPFHRVLEWHAREEVENLQREFAGRPVLVGVVLPYADDHAAPVQLADWPIGNSRTPALLLHAQARRNLLDGGLLRAAPKALALAAAGAAALLWFFSAGWVRALAATTSVSVLLVAVSAWLVTRGWVFPVGTVLVAAVVAAGARFAFDRLATRPSSSPPSSLRLS